MRRNNNIIYLLFKKALYLAITAAVLICLFIGYQFHHFQNLPISMTSESVTFSIKKGETIRQVSQNLKDAGFINDHLMFIVLAKLNGEETRIKAGEYRLKAQDTPQDLLNHFIKGSSVNYSFTIIEGWTYKQLTEAIMQDPILEQTETLSDYKTVMSSISAQGSHPEGLFLPDTYHFPRGTSDIQFLKRANITLSEVLEKEWALRADNLPLKTPYEALILASIIEKETGVTYEMPLISAAFIKRLQKNMRLQTDPTIIYGLGDKFDGNIRYRDLRKDTPYNTYIHKGLTPTPISLPGREAIHAALHPADSNAIFFVSKGDGTHHFSETLDEHNAAVRKYQLKGRKPKRKAESG